MSETHPVMSKTTPVPSPISERWQGARLGLLFEWTDVPVLHVPPHFWASLCKKAGARYAIFSPIFGEMLSDTERAYLTEALNFCVQEECLTGLSPLWIPSAQIGQWKDMGLLQIAWTPPHVFVHHTEQENGDLFCNDGARSQPNFVTLERGFGEWLSSEPWETLDWLVLDSNDPLNSPMRSLRTLIDLLVRSAVRGGNLLLSVPVFSQGVDTRHQRRLEQLGNWLRLYGHTLYNTQAGPYPPQLWGGCTWRENYLYVHVLDWVDEEITLPLPDGHIRRITCLTASSIAIQRTATRLSFRVPPDNQQDVDTIIAIELDQPWA